MLAELISHKTDLRKFRRMLVHQVQIFSELVKVPPPQVGAERVHEIQGVCEQRERTSSLASLHSEVTCDLVEGHISLASHRLSNIVNVLTIFTAVFLPLGFLGGIDRMTL